MSAGAAVALDPAMGKLLAWKPIGAEEKRWREKHVRKAETQKRRELRTRMHLVEDDWDRTWPKVWEGIGLVGLGDVSCVVCRGDGRAVSRAGKWYPCKCVLRRVFRATLRRYLEIASSGRQFRVDCGMGFAYCRKAEEFSADVICVARRVLDDDGWKLFRMHFVEGKDWKYCCPRLGLGRGLFFHAVYRVEDRAGRAFLENGIFPQGVYFGGSYMGLMPAIPVSKRRGWRSVLAEAA